MVPGVYAGELSITGSDWVHLTHLILTIFAIWQVQPLAERWTTKPRAAIAALIFLLLPVTRYWGQFQLLDLPVAGMFLFVIHALFVAERKRKAYWFLGLLGFLAGILFLTKYVFIYTIGLAGWFILKDKNLFRAKWFTIGFLISVFGCLGFLVSGILIKTDIPLSSGFINIPAFLIFIPITIVMAKVGATTVHKMKKEIIAKLFGFFLIIIASRFLYDYFNL